MELSLFTNLLTLNSSEYDYLANDDSLSPLQKQYREIYRYYSKFHIKHRTTAFNIPIITYDKLYSLEPLSIGGKEYPALQNLELKPLSPTARKHLTGKSELQNHQYSFHGSTDYNTGEHWEQIHLQFSHPYSVHKTPSNLNLGEHIHNIQILDTYTETETPLYSKWTHRVTSRHFRAFLAPNNHLIINTDGFVTMTVKEI